MIIKLDRFEIIALQTIRRNPGRRFSGNISDLIDFNLIKPSGTGYMITLVGNQALKMNTPILDCGQNMSKVLGFNPKKKKL